MTDQKPEIEDLERLLGDIEIRMNSQNQNKIGEESITTVAEVTEIGEPIYGAKINPYKSTWEISNPISLTKTKNTDGIFLKKGFYKIEYEVNILEDSYSGLAIFDPKDYKIITIIAWYFCNKGQSKHLNGSKYYKTSEEVILGITNNKGEHKPEAQIGTTFLTIHKLAKATLP